MSSRLPIGVFDSGLGGLSVLRELRRELPNEDFLYLGDVARLPYGTKSSNVVTRYAKTCVSFLVDKKVKLVVIACNTATAAALDAVRAECPVEVVGVIEPGVRAGIEASRSGKVLVLGTAATTKRGAYLDGFRRYAPGIEVESIACPLLVPLAEEGWFDHPITTAVIGDYLSRARGGFDAVVLGCTHYPFLEESFRKALPGATAIVHGGPRLAREVRERLELLGMRNDAPAPGRVELFSTDYIARSVPLVDSLFGGSSAFELIDLA